MLGVLMHIIAGQASVLQSVPLVLLQIDIVCDVLLFIKHASFAYTMQCWCCRGTANGEVFEDTRQRGKPIVFIYGGRPFTGGLCKGVEEAMASMKAGRVCLSMNV